MSLGRAFGCALAVPCCLISSGALWVCQRAGWRSDGPGLICPMAIGFIAGLFGVIGLWSALTSPSSST